MKEAEKVLSRMKRDVDVRRMILSGASWLESSVE